MDKKSRMEFVRAALRGYERLSEESRVRTSRAEWVALKLGCSERQAERYIAEAEASA